MIEGISAVTLATHDMRRAVRFYCSLGFDILYGGEASSFTSFRAGATYLNLIALYHRALAAGHHPTAVPRDAEWGERYFHLTDADGHELSFARPLQS